MTVGLISLALPSSAPPPPPPVTGWASLDIGGGGWIIGLDIAPDGSMLVRTDTFGAYLGSVTPGTEWQQLVNINSMPSGYAGFTTSASATKLGLGSSAGIWNLWTGGVFEIVFAPSNSSIIYMAYMGLLFKSTDKGTTWTLLTGFSFDASFEETNIGYRWGQQKMAVDPNNANVVLFGSPQTGLWLTTDGGTTWAQVSSVPDAMSDGSGAYPGINGIVFDPSSGTTGGKTNTVYVAVYGHGVYRSTTTATGTFSLLAGSPTNVNSATMDSGNYYASGNQELNVYKSGSWSLLATDTNQGINYALVKTISANTYIVYGGGAGAVNTSKDGGATWSGVHWTETYLASDCPWLALNHSLGANGGCMWDPVVAGRIWVTGGTACWYTDTLAPNLTNYSAGNFWTVPTVYNSQTAGIEQLVACSVVSPPGGNPICGVQDKQFFVIDDPAAFPSIFGIGTADYSDIMAAWDVAYAATSPSTIVALINSVIGQGDNSGYSNDFGVTWHNFGTAPGGGTGGSIAASTATNFIVHPCGTNNVLYTTDGGSTWHAASGLPGSGWNTYDENYYIKELCADGATANKFYAAVGKNIYASTDGGATWTAKNTTTLLAQGGYWQIKAAPGVANNLFYTPGLYNQGVHPNATPFYRSTDGGTTWTAISNVQDVWVFGLGAPKGGAYTYPTVWIVGWVTVGVNAPKWGVWVSKDNCSSWTWLIDWPFDHVDVPSCMSGDGNDPTRCYIGYCGSGFAYGSSLSF